jgi:hypothetical protein
MREIHFYEYNPPLYIGALHDYRHTHYAIQCGKFKAIHTTQMGLLSTSLLEKGYHIFIHEYGREPYEIKLGDNECTNRYIRAGHNLFKMWVSGEFAKKG